MEKLLLIKKNEEEILEIIKTMDINKSLGLKYYTCLHLKKL